MISFYLSKMFLEKRGNTSGAGTKNSSGAPEFTPGF
jgi:hypothetical protein